MNRAERRALLKHGKCKHDWQPKSDYYPDVMVCTKCTSIADRTDLGVSPETNGEQK